MPLVPLHIQNLISYKPGKTIDELKSEYGLDFVIKLASNENPEGASPKALTAVLETLNENFRYPDAFSFKLRQKLAERYKLKIENVTVGAGSEGIISTIMRTFLRLSDEIIAADNSFIGFRVIANSSAAKTHWIPLNNYRHDLSAIAKIINNNTKIIYLANPDNPTGTYINIEEFNNFMKKVPQKVLVILDEAYFEYAQNIDDYPDSMHYRYDNVITLRTFSKAYGLAGFRAGYGFAHKILINNINKVKLPFEPSWPAQVASLASLDDNEYIEQTLINCKKQMERMISVFKGFNIKYIPSSANFITIIFKTAEESIAFYNGMLNKGIILRHLLDWGHSNCIRITAGTQEENNYFIDSISSMFD